MKSIYWRFYLMQRIKSNSHSPCTIIFDNTRYHTIMHSLIEVDVIFFAWRLYYLLLLRYCYYNELSNKLVGKKLNFSACENPSILGVFEWIYWGQVLLRDKGLHSNHLQVSKTLLFSKIGNNFKNKSGIKNGVQDAKE